MRNNIRDDLLDLHRKHVKAWEQKDLSGLRAIYAEEAIVFNTVPPPRFSDFKTFENTLQHYFGKLSELTFFTSNIQIEVMDKVAWITSQYLLAYQVAGKLLRENGRWTEIFQKEEDEWKLRHLHASPDPLQSFIAPD